MCEKFGLPQEMLAIMLPELEEAIKKVTGGMTLE